jgi:ELWxxDGT repeat protein
VELWGSNGTGSGTALIKDINPGTGQNGFPRTGDPQGFVVVGKKALFVANSKGHGYELWRTNGTAAGTAMVRDIRQGGGGVHGSQLRDLSRLTGVGVVFYANDGVHGHELWKSNGWHDRTVLVKDIWPGPDPSSSGAVGSYVTTFGTLGWFAADDGTHGVEPWTTDGSEAGTGLLKNINH